MKKILISLLFAAFFFQYCGTKTITRKYYMLDFPPVADSVLTSAPLTDGSCEIKPANIPPAFSQYRIAVRERSHEISYYTSHQWAMEPSELITDLVRSKVKSSNLFKYISESSWRELPKFQVVTQINELEAIKVGDDLAAHISGRMELVSTEDKSTVVYHDFNHREILEQKDINLLADQLSIILFQEINIFLIQVKNYLLKHDALPKNLEIIP